MYFYNESTTWAMTLMGFLFPALAIRISRKHLGDMPQEKKLINSISYLLMSISVLSLVFKVGQLCQLLSVQHTIIGRDIVYSLLLVICLVIIRYKYVGVMSTLPVKTAIVELPVTMEPVTPRKTLLTTTEHQQILTALEAHLRKTKIFTDAALSLDKLAQGTGISKYHISEALNSYACKSFYQYINEWRIQRATEQIRFMNEKALPVNG